jgi:hypothetical protein
MKRKPETRSRASRYERISYEAVAVFELLLPLTREAQLKQTLDNLFYADTVRRRIREIDVDELEKSVPKKSGESEQSYTERLIESVSKKFGGYSITHVNGRYRTREMISRAEAGELYAGGITYLDDETTAMVRFFIPIDASSEARPHPDKVEREYREIAGLFFLLFVDTITRVVDEEEILLIESGYHERLHRYVRR